MNAQFERNHLIIIGGTSGIGLALGKSYLLEGWQVTLIGSSADKISHLTHTLTPEYPEQLALYQCDISHPNQLQDLFATLQQTPFQRLIYSAGWYLNERKRKLNQADSDKMLAVNLQAFQQVFHWASEQLKQNNKQPIIEKKHVKKHLICLASVAGMLDYPESSLYAKCKGAMIAAAQAYRAGLEPYDIGVTCIASGYVDTAQLRCLNDGNASHKPYLISEDEAVTEIRHAIEHNLALHCFPRPMKRMISTLELLPKPVLSWVMKWQYRKQDGKQ